MKLFRGAIDFAKGAAAIRLAAAILCLTVAAEAAHAARRLALVIGNDAYVDVPRLHKAVNDANAVAARLRDQDFQVTLATDVTRRAMNRAISRFAADIDAGDVVFVFYAGHGVEISGENYLLPVDVPRARPGDEEFIKAESIGLSRLLDRVRAAGAATNIAIIDACRDNPFEQVATRSLGGRRGLGRIVAPEGTFVIFSAGAGQSALDRLSADDADPNSVFTRALLPLMGEPGLPIRDLALKLRREVKSLASTVSHRQVPAYYDELIGQFYFGERTKPKPAVARPASDLAAAQAAFAAARDAESPSALKFVETKYPDTVFAVLAREMREKLEAEPKPEIAAAEEEVALLAPAPAEQSPISEAEEDAAPEEGSAIAPEAPQPTPEEAEGPPPTPEDAEAALGLDRDARRDVQWLLNALGHDAGAADGLFGPRTRRAIAGFQAAADLEATGFLNEPALDQLKRAGAPALVIYRERIAREEEERREREEERRLADEERRLEEQRQAQERERTWLASASQSGGLTSLGIVRFGVENRLSSTMAATLSNYFRKCRGGRFTLLGYNGELLVEVRRRLIGMGVPGRFVAIADRSSSVTDANRSLIDTRRVDVRCTVE